VSVGIGYPYGCECEWLICLSLCWRKAEKLSSGHGVGCADLIIRGAGEQGDLSQRGDGAAYFLRDFW